MFERNKRKTNDTKSIVKCKQSTKLDTIVKNPTVFEPTEKQNRNLEQYVCTENCKNKPK